MAMHAKRGITAVARAAGVSPAAVSRVLGKDASFRAGEETRSRIEQAARAIGYVSDARARQLRKGVSSLVGVLADDLGSSYMTMIFDHLNTELIALRNEVLLGLFAGDALIAERHIVSFRAHRTCAVLVLARGASLTPAVVELLAGETRECGPIMVVCFTLPPPPPMPGLTIDLPWVLSEFAHAARSAGYARAVLALRGGLNPDRLEALFQAALGQAGGLPGNVVHTPTNDPEAVARNVCLAVRERCREGRVAVMTTVDTDAVAIAQGLATMGFRVPEDVGVVGYGNLGMDAFTRPRITTFDVTGTIPHMVRHIIGLLRLVHSTGQLAARTESFRPPLLVRESFLPGGAMSKREPTPGGEKNA